MSDIIQLLPDSVANQIAAGEVIQRPASVVKELLENAIDAEADTITLNIENAGRTLIELIDNGKGMSETDARMAFERHATSKIKDAPDLFQIQTMGFRGEALASISAISDVELKTKNKDSELGTYIQIKGSKVLNQEPISCSRGSIFSVRDLFFNVPARRKFLKKNATEYQHIVHEFRKVALAYPEKNFRLINDGQTIYDLRDGSIADRIRGFYGKNMQSQLLPVSADTEMLKIYGFTGKPDIAKKSKGEQFFFVNRRYMKHPYFFKAVMTAYENILKSDSFPAFFLYFIIDPERVDVNIHPAKTEINFEDSKGIFAVIRAVIKETLGKYNVAPSIDFDREGEPDIPLFTDRGMPQLPKEDIDENYNPFEEKGETHKDGNKGEIIETRYSSGTFDDYDRDNFIDKFENAPDNQNLFSDTTTVRQENYLQIANKYILTAAKSGVMIISQKRAYERIAFEEFLNKTRTDSVGSQRLMYPIDIQLNTPEYEDFIKLKDKLKPLGFEISSKPEDTVCIEALPSYFERLDEKFLIEQILNLLKEEPDLLEEKFNETIAAIVAQSASASYSGKRLAEEEIQSLTERLFACRMPNFNPGGLPVIKILETETLDKFLDK